MAYLVSTATNPGVKPAYLGITFSCNDRPTHLKELKAKFDSNGLNTRFQGQSPISKWPSIILSEVFTNPAQGSVERLNIVGTQKEQTEKPADPSDPLNWKDIGLVIAYTKQFLEARGFLVENPKEKSE